MHYCVIYVSRKEVHAEENVFIKASYQFLGEEGNNEEKGRNVGTINYRC